MHPRFRSDLKCSREEQQGVVFYRVDDPKSQTSFRLYEIEYLIAQKLDGQRSLADIIQAVKAEYNFDISEPDLQKFVGQLDSMSFLHGQAAAPGEADAREGEAAQPDPELAEADVVADADLIEQPSSDVDEVELKRLLKSALLHVRQGYIVHARDYFLAARELSPTDPRVSKLVGHLEIIGDASGPAEVEYLWNQAKELFPEIAAEVGPLADTRRAPAGDGGESDALPGEDSLKSRLVWLSLLLVLVLGGGGALYYFARMTRVFEGAAKATVAVIKSQRVPIYYQKPAESVRSARETWLQLAASGKVATVAVTPGKRVQADEVLVALALPPALEKQVAAARAALKKAESEHAKAAVRLDKVLDERKALEAERDGLDARGGRRPAAKKDADKLKKTRARLSKKLAALAKKEKAPRAAEAKSRKKMDDARKKLEALEQKSAQKRIRAPFAGLVVEVAVRPGQSVNDGQKAVLLRDNLEARLAFVLADAGRLTAGGEAFVSVARGVPSRGKVALVQPIAAGKRVEVTITDPAGSFVDMAPQEFRLVREFAERAFEVPASAVVSRDQRSHVLVELQGRALVREVEVMSRDAATAVVRDQSGNLRDGDHVVVDRIGGEGGVASIVDGSFLDVQ